MISLVLELLVPVAAGLVAMLVFIGLFVALMALFAVTITSPLWLLLGFAGGLIGLGVGYGVAAI